MNRAATFLIVDDVDENRYLLGKTLQRKFHAARVLECLDSADALAVLESEKPEAVIVHRARDLDGVALVQAIRRAAPTTPIVMVSGRDQCPEALAAGANAFLNYDAWLRIGTIVEEVMSPEYVKALTRTPFKSDGDFLGVRR